MKLKTYAKMIAELAEKYPNFDIVYASDSEGNSFHKVYFKPSLGRFIDGDFESLENLEKDEKDTINVVCIN